MPIPALEGAAEVLQRGADRFEVFARTGAALGWRRDSSGHWEQRSTREVGVACRAVCRKEVAFSAAAGASSRAGREAGEAALAGASPGADPLPPIEALGTTPCAPPPAGFDGKALEAFARSLAAAVAARSADIEVLDLRLLAAVSETTLLRGEGFLATAHGAGLVLELLLAASDGPARLLHVAAPCLEELDQERIAEKAVETVLLVARGSHPSTGLVDVVAAPAVAAELVAALARELVRCRLDGEHRLVRAHVSPAWHLLDARAGPVGVLPAPFDGEGLPARTLVMLAGGHQHEVPLTWTAGRQCGALAGGALRPSYRTPPVSAPANLAVVAEAPQSPRELLQQLGNGLYLALPAGATRVDERHGRFSLPCAATVIGGGRATGACPLLEIRGSFRHLLGALEACGSDTESFAFTCAVSTPSLLLRRVELT
jgi:predicted Zn-dependent protease